MVSAPEILSVSSTRHYRKQNPVTTITRRHGQRFGGWREQTECRMGGTPGSYREWHSTG
jgi:hypothetical protein